MTQFLFQKGNSGVALILDTVAISPAKMSTLQGDDFWVELCNSLTDPEFIRDEV